MHIYVYKRKKLGVETGNKAIYVLNYTYILYAPVAYTYLFLPMVNVCRHSALEKSFSPTSLHTLALKINRE